MIVQRLVIATQCCIVSDRVSALDSTSIAACSGCSFITTLGALVPITLPLISSKHSALHAIALHKASSASVCQSPPVRDSNRETMLGSSSAICRIPLQQGCG